METIENDLGLKKNGTAAILERLKRQGVNAVSVDVKGEADDDPQLKVRASRRGTGW